MSGSKPLTDTFEELLLPVLTPAYGLARHLTGNSGEAEDLVQEACLLALRGFQTFQIGTSFRSWFFRILTNAFYSRYRKQKRAGTAVDLEDVPELYLYKRTRDLGLHARTDDPAGVVMDRIDVEAVEAAIAALPEEYRVAAMLYFLEDMSYQEIADVLEVPVGTVRSRLHRGRRMLQKALWHHAEDRGIVAALMAEEA